MIFPKMVNMFQFSHVHIVSYENGMFLVILQLILHLLIKPLWRKLNLETVRPQKLNRKVIVITHVHQMINILIMIAWTHWKETFKYVYLLMDVFYWMTFSLNVQKVVKKKELNVKLLNLIMYMRQKMTLSITSKLLTIFPCFLINFMNLMNFKTLFIKWWRNQTYWLFFQGSRMCSLWWEHRKEKLTASNFYTVTVNKVASSKKNKVLVLFFSFCIIILCFILQWNMILLMKALL